MAALGRLRAELGQAVAACEAGSCRVLAD
jgi:hypothetical protein